MFSISDKVVCVDDRNPADTNVYPGGFVSKGVVYVVCGFSPLAGGPQIVGKPVISTISGRTLGWKASRFRKLDDIKAQKAAAFCANAENQAREPSGPAAINQQREYAN